MVKGQGEAEFILKKKVGKKEKNVSCLNKHNKPNRTIRDKCFLHTPHPHSPEKETKKRQKRENVL